ncbi:MAG: carboxypeptidase regulatory-like domain-containing protein [Planctomycetota bacterium]|nr:carboxypeptidase regulatory-like domain-containing protein [Planctomycetota bacterium]
MQIPISLPVLAGVCLTAELLCQQQPPAAPAPAPVKATVSGRVSLAEADRAAAKPLEVGEEAAKGCGEVDKRDPNLQFDAKGGLAHAVVTVSVRGQAVKPLEKPVQIDQRSCKFEPYVTVVPTGSTVEYMNSDKVNHNVNLNTAKNEAMNSTLTPGLTKTAKFEKADRMQATCSTHTWMRSWVVATDTNFYAVTGADGSFRIEGLPAGEHKLEVWYPGAQKLDATLKIDAEGKSAPLELELTFAAKKGRRDK